METYSALLALCAVRKLTVRHSNIRLRCRLINKTFFISSRQACKVRDDKVYSSIHLHGNDCSSQGKPVQLVCWRCKHSIDLLAFQKRTHDSQPIQHLLIHSGLETEYDFIYLGYHRFRYWLIACPIPSHDLLQCWLIVDWTPSYKNNILVKVQSLYSR